MFGVRLECGQSVLFEEYMDMLEKVADKDASVQLQASWGRRLWRKWIADIFGQLQSKEALQKANLIQQCDDMTRRKQQQADANLFISVTVRAGAQRAWMMLAMNDLPPANWKG